MKKAKRTGNKQKSLFNAELPQMPEGYYSGDQPNPNLRAFVENHIREHPFDPETDKYDVPAFDRPIDTTKATAIYNMHTYWSKKPHDAIRQYIKHYTKSGDLVLDPFCGSGGTALAALMEGRKAIAIDRSPAATFITKNYCAPADLNELQQAFDHLSHNAKPKIDWLYETRCDRCGGKATTEKTVYSQIFQCSRCLEKVPLFDCVKADGQTAKGKPKKINTCPNCHKKGIVEEISTRGQRFGTVPVLVSYICDSGCKPARDERRYNDSIKKKREYFEKYDLGKLTEIEAKEIPYWYPTDRMMHAPNDQECWGVKWRAGTSNFRRVDELFTKRNLWALALLFESIHKIPNIELSDTLSFCVTGILLGVSRMNRYMPHATFPFYLITGTYYMPPIMCEEPIWKHFHNKFKRIYKGYQSILSSLNSAALTISTHDARNQDAIENNSIDYIFTDPSYAEKVQYGELNFIWESWLRLDNRWHNEEIIVNPVRGKTESDWAEMIRHAMAECYRVLKPGRWISLCYHDTSEGTWALVQDIMAEVGFFVERSEGALYIDTQQKSYNQLVADKVNRRDLVINFRKPKIGELRDEVLITGEENESTFNEKVKIIISEYLVAKPGSTKDRIYDEVVSRMVRSGRMEPHDFESILHQVADEIVTPIMKNLFEKKEPDLFGGHERRRWYLKEIEISEQDEAETLKEDKAAKILGDLINEYLEKYPEQEGMHYSDLFERHVYRVTDKPRRHLADFLPDYFFKTDAGTWRLPSTEEEERLKAEGRAKGTLRCIKRYLSFIEQNLPVPEKEQPNGATIAEWIRHCKRSGLYEQGKLLYEKGGLNLEALSETDQAYVEEDYDTCVRYFNRGR